MKKVFWVLGAIVFLVIASANLETLPEYASLLQPPFRGTFLRVYAWQWFFMVAVLLLCLVAWAASRAVAWKLTFLRDRLSPHPMSVPTRKAIARSAALLAASLLASVLLPSARISQVAPKLNAHMEVLNQGLTILAMAMLIYAFWDATCDTIAARAEGIRRAERLLVPMMRKFVQAIIVIVGAFLILAVFFGPKTLTGLVASLGVTGLVVALAGKDSIENVFGSMTILFDMPFALGDFVKIDKVEGSVEEINLRSTRIRTVEDTLITLPNANLIRASVENFGARRLRRQKLTVRLSFESEPDGIEGFCESLRSFLNSQEVVESSKTQVQLDEPTETSLGVVAIWFLNVASPLEEAQSRTQLLDEVLRQKARHGLQLMGLPVQSGPKP